MFYTGQIMYYLQTLLHFGFPIMWMAVVVISLIIEMITVGLTTIWFAGGALIAFIMAALHAPVWSQILVFIIVSFILLFFTRPFVIKYVNPRKVRTNSEGLLGAIVKVTKKIDNRALEGQVIANGMEWSARTIEDTIVIEKDTLAKVVRIEGVKLIVEPIEK